MGKNLRPSRLTSGGLTRGWSRLTLKYALKDYACLPHVFSGRGWKYLKFGFDV